MQYALDIAIKHDDARAIDFCEALKLCKGDDCNRIWYKAVANFTSRRTPYELRSVRHLPFYIGSQAIEFVDKWPHLGHIISNDCDDAADILTEDELHRTG